MSHFIRLPHLTLLVLQGQSSGQRGTREECYEANLVAENPLNLNGLALCGGPSTRTLAPRLTNQGRDVAQAISRWVPTAAARLRVRGACGICGGHSGIGAGFFRVLRVPLPSFLQFLRHNHTGLAQ
jgi:hypothetical protein